MAMTGEVSEEEEIETTEEIEIIEEIEITEEIEMEETIIMKLSAQSFWPNLQLPTRPRN